MAFTLDQIEPWGRSFDEYVAMFHLAAGDLDKTTVGCADGPASFNARMRARGNRVVSVDPLCDCLRTQHYPCGIEDLDYEFQRGDNEMLQVANAGARQ